jgi:Na+/H+-dicarboxylate symporter
MKFYYLNFVCAALNLLCIFLMRNTLDGLNPQGIINWAAFILCLATGIFCWMYDS